MSKWKEYKTSDLLGHGLLVIGDGYRAKNVELSASKFDGLPFARVGNINGGFDFHEADYFPTSKLERVGEKISKVGDVVFTSKGTVGRFAFVVDQTPLFVYSPQLCFWRSLAKDFIFPRFLFYWMQSREFCEQADAVKSQTDMADYVNLSDQRKMKITLPEINEQRAIASILSNLDDKIDLLHRQNTTLEKMAKTLFRRWFVEDAKEDWKEGNLSDLVLVKYGKDHKKLLDGKIPVFGSGGLMRYADKSLYDKESVLIPRKGSLNNVMYQDEPFWTVDTMFYTEMKVPNVAKFVYHFLKGQDLASMNVGSAVPSMTTEILNNMPLSVPPKEVFEKFEGAVATFYAKTKSNKTQIRTLTALRDTLLPKLMSGEVRVEM